MRLEPLGLEHVERLHAAAQYPALWQYAIVPMLGLDDIRAYVERALAEQALGHAMPFAQIETAGGVVVGSTRFANIELRHQRLEIGWTWISPEYQRSGINTEAKYMLLRHAFETLSMRRVEFKSDARNSRSRAALERIGAQYEGTLRCHMRTADGLMRDSVYYSIIAEEWPQIRLRLEALLAQYEHSS